MKALLNAGTSDLRYVNPMNGFNLLQDAAWVGNNEAGRLLLESGAFDGRMEEEDGTGRTALHLAAVRADPEFCKMLCDFGADPNKKENTHRWAPQAAADIADGVGKPESARLLRELMTTMDAVKFGTRLKMKARNAHA